MANDAHWIDLHLTYEEAQELFARCLKSADEDTPGSRSALRKLAQALHKQTSENADQQAS